jgi:hypothetical protein
MNPLRTLVTIAILLFGVASPAFALEPGKDGWYNTGDGVRTKTVAIITAKVYAIRHDMKGPLPAKSKQAVIDADVDKRFSWYMLRDVEGEKIQKALRDAFAMNGYGDQGKIGQFVGAFSKELKEKGSVSISYSAATKTVSVWVAGGGSASIGGADFMKAVWSIWFGKIDQPSLGDALISRM